MIYIDTSLIVAALTEEVDNERILKWLARQSAGALAISRWTITEVSSALSLKVQTGAVGVDFRATALSVWRRWASDSLVILPVESSHYIVAAGFADQHELGLRGGDALHLAIAAADSRTLAALDKKMAKAAPMLGVPVAALD